LPNSVLRFGTIVLLFGSPCDYAFDNAFSSRASLMIAGAIVRGDDTQPKSLATARESERKDTEHQMADCPVIPPTSLTDAVSFRVEQNKLTVCTRIAPTNGMSRVIVPELAAGLTKIDVHGAQSSPRHSLHTAHVALHSFRFSINRARALHRRRDA